MEQPILQFPNASQSLLLMVGVVLLALFFGAIAMEFLRRQLHRRNLIKSEWRLVEKMAQDRNLTSEEWGTLRDILTRWASSDPLEAATVRWRFDQCVDEEMSALSSPQNVERFRDRGVLLRGIRVRFGLDYVPFGQRIESTRDLQPGQTIWFSPILNVPRWSRGSVLAVDEAYLHVTLKGDKDSPIAALKPGDEIRCRLWRESDARYVFTVPLVQSGGNPPTWTFLHTSKLERFQSRGYYRIHYNQETSLAILSAPDGEVGEDRRVVTELPARFASLSAGGFAAIVHQSLPRDVFLRVGLALPGEKSLKADARVVGIEPLSSGRYLVRASFATIPEEVRDSIARYVLRQQRPAADEPERAATQGAE